MFLACLCIVVVCRTFVSSTGKVGCSKLLWTASHPEKGVVVYVWEGLWRSLAMTLSVFTVLGRASGLVCARWRHYCEGDVSLRST